MPDQIYIVDPATKQLTLVVPTSFSSLGLGERRDLEEWVIGHPEMLGEPLLVVTSEFARFDKSNRRLDLLAIDRDGSLVVVELKLELRNSFADQQAIRYAAFCSTMTMDQVVEALSMFESTTEDEARQKIGAFLDTDAQSLPELDNRPRIILAAGSVDDQELTRTVLWLRTFGLDISCVELTPYRLGEGSVLLSSKILIPLPEARDYLVLVEQKQVAEVHRAKEASATRPLWHDIALRFNELQLDFRARPARGAHMQVSIGHPEVHYEWGRLKAGVRVALHFESTDRDTNLSRLALIEPHADAVSAGIKYPISAAPWGRNWASVEFLIPFQDERQDDLPSEAAQLMAKLIEHTYPLLKPVLSGERHGSQTGSSD